MTDLALVCGEPEDVVAESKIRFRPMCEKMLVRLLPIEERRKSGLYDMGKAERELREGIVVALGPGRHRRDAKYEQDTIPINHKIGECVLFGKGAALLLDLESPDIACVSEDAIIAVRTSDE